MIELNGIHHVFTRAGRGVHALCDVSLRVAESDFIAVVGPSGCGKSTLLNLVAGLIQPIRGEVRYDGRPVREVNRRVGYMTQKDTLLPWRTVEANIALPLEVRGAAVQERMQRAREMAALVDLHGFENAYPHELSGGMRKRVALARTWIYDPETLLMDEPFGALDAQTRIVLQSELLQLWSKRRKTVLFITHDLGEAISLATRVIVMTRRPGRIKLDRAIDFGSERDVFQIRFSPEFARLHEELWTSLREEVALRDAP
jgi:NitT/TauT family transport system ATP-binding protein